MLSGLLSETQTASASALTVFTCRTFLSSNCNDFPVRRYSVLFKREDERNINAEDNEADDCKRKSHLKVILH